MDSGEIVGEARAGEMFGTEWSGSAIGLVQLGSGEREYKRDYWGYPVRTDSDTCISFINSFYHQVLMYGADRRIILKAADSDRSCVLACALAAMYSLSQRDARGQVTDAAVYLSAAKHNLDRATMYERLVLAVVAAWAEGQVEDVLALHFQLVAQFPKDLVSLKRAQTLCFYMGRQEDMLMLALQALPANQESPFMHGMLAFALVEVGGRMREAELAARKSLAIESHDPWAHHAHPSGDQLVPQGNVKGAGGPFSYPSRADEVGGERWKFVTAAHDEVDGLGLCDCQHNEKYSHNWWHMAMCWMEQGGSTALDRVLAIYDTHIWGPNHGADRSQEYLNALGLLLRLDLRGHHSSVDVRMANMTGYLLDEVSWHKEWLQDLLVVWGLSRGGHSAGVNRLLKSLTHRVEAMEVNRRKVLQCVVTLARALYEYGRGNFKAASQLLGPDSTTGRFKAGVSILQYEPRLRNTWPDERQFFCQGFTADGLLAQSSRLFVWLSMYMVMGASDEQVDVFEELWCVACLRAGQPLPVVQVVERRVMERGLVPFTWRILEEAYSKAGELEKAKSAASRAIVLEISSDISI